MWTLSMSEKTSKYHKKNADLQVIRMKAKHSKEDRVAMLTISARRIGWLCCLRIHIVQTSRLF
jgi:hypothetical protein